MGSVLAQPTPTIRLAPDGVVPAATHAQEFREGHGQRRQDYHGFADKVYDRSQLIELTVIARG